MIPNEEIFDKLESYIDGALDAAGRAEVERQLSTNPQLRTLVNELLVTRDAVRALPRAQAPIDLAETLQGSLERGALLGDDVSGTPDADMRINRWPHVMSMAAIVLLAVGLAAVIYQMVLPHKRAPMLAQNGAGNEAPAVDSPMAAATSPKADADKSVAMKDVQLGVTPLAAPGGGGGSGGGGVESDVARRASDPRMSAKPASEVAAIPTTPTTLAGVIDPDAAKVGFGAAGMKGGDASQIGGLAVSGTGRAVVTADEIREQQLRITGKVAAGVGEAAQKGQAAAAATDEPVIMLVQSLDPKQANQDVAQYLLSNKIAYVALSDSSNPDGPIPANAAGASSSLNGAYGVATGAPEGQMKNGGGFMNRGGTNNGDGIAGNGVSINNGSTTNSADTARAFDNNNGDRAGNNSVQQQQAPGYRGGYAGGQQQQQPPMNRSDAGNYANNDRSGGNAQARGGPSAPVDNSASNSVQANAARPSAASTNPQAPADNAPPQQQQAPAMPSVNEQQQVELNNGNLVLGTVNGGALGNVALHANTYRASLTRRQLQQLNDQLKSRDNQWTEVRNEPRLEAVAVNAAQTRGLVAGEAGEMRKGSEPTAATPRPEAPEAAAKEREADSVARLKAAATDARMKELESRVADEKKKDEIAIVTPTPAAQPASGPSASTRPIDSMGSRVAARAPARPVEGVAPAPIGLTTGSASDRSAGTQPASQPVALSKQIDETAEYAMKREALTGGRATTEPAARQADGGTFSKMGPGLQPDATLTADDTLRTVLIIVNEQPVNLPTTLPTTTATTQPATAPADVSAAAQPTTAPAAPAKPADDSDR